MSRNRHPGRTAPRLVIGAVLVAFTMTCLTATPSSASSASAGRTEITPATDRRDCSSLDRVSFGNARVTASEDVPAGDFVPPGASAQSNLPAFCRVAIAVDPAITVEAWLPREWNGRLLGTIIGGWAGVLNYDGMASGLRNGYAAVSTDTGHRAGSPDWMLDNDGDLDPGLVRDYAHRAAHQMTLKAKRVIRAYYGELPDYSYYRGCSGGGRQGMALAQLYPDDYDGILAEAPAFNIPSFLTSDLWPQLSRLQNEGLSNCQLETLHQAVVSECDGRDGLADGQISDPRRCDFDANSLVCSGETQTCDCLSKEQIQLVNDTFDGPRDNSGRSIWFGFDQGSEAGWGQFPLGDEPFSAAVEFQRYMVHRDPEWRWEDFEPDADTRLADQEFGDLLNSDDPRLGKFKARGGKLVMWHGWADQIIPAQGTVKYFDSVRRHLGTLESSKFARLYLAPGVAHCSGGDGPDTFDMFSELVAWVERRDAPDRVTASKVIDGEVARTRPLCPYPLEARYRGTGSIEEHTSFVCR